MLDNLTPEQREKFRGSLAYADLQLHHAAELLKDAEEAAAAHSTELQRVLAEQALELEELKARHAAQLNTAVEVLKRSHEPVRARLESQRRHLDAAVGEARAAHQAAREVFHQRRDVAPQ